MVDGIMLTEKTKEELIEQILSQYKTIEEQAAKIRELEEKVKAEQRKRTEKFAKTNVVKKRRKRPGQKVGHVGMTRAVPHQIDEVIEGLLRNTPKGQIRGNHIVERISQIFRKRPFRNSPIQGVS